MALQQDGGLNGRKEASSPESTSKGEAEGLPRGACVGRSLQGGSSRSREARAHLGTPRSFIRMGKGKVCKYVQERQFNIKSSRKVLGTKS